jgi:histone acetyltransferase (RNA polymerase elongator complex component)
VSLELTALKQTLNPETRTVTPFIIPIFLPQMGCPYHCLYCHQERITRSPSKILDKETFSSLVELGLSSKRKKPGQEIEIAFFGGTFTNLPVNFQTQLLGWAAPYLSQKRVTSLRLSTRPDALSEKKIEQLLALGIKTIELGVQSLNDKVLNLSKRGHNAQDTIQALDLLKKYPITIGVQLMTGLPGDSPETFIATIKQVIDHKPDFIRIYPTLVFQATPLAQWFKEKRYFPLSLDEAVTLCCQALEHLEAAGIRVIRLGLQDHEGLRFGKDLIAGPFHPAFGSLVRGELYLKKLLRDLMPNQPFRLPLVLHIAPQDSAYLLGNKKRNLILLSRQLEVANIEIKIAPQLSPGTWQSG